MSLDPARSHLEPNAKTAPQTQPLPFTAAKARTHGVTRPDTAPRATAHTTQRTPRERASIRRTYTHTHTHTHKHRQQTPLHYTHTQGTSESTQSVSLSMSMSISISISISISHVYVHMVQEQSGVCSRKNARTPSLLLSSLPPALTRARTHAHTHTRTHQQITQMHSDGTLKPSGGKKGHGKHSHVGSENFVLGGATYFYK